MERIRALEYIRGAAMLGVVGIHTGAYSLSNPDMNIHLFALLEIISRFSVPIFFFVSAFGLFLHHNIEGPFRYGTFIKRRFRAVLLPYLSWSLLYMLHYTWVSQDWLIWEKPLVYHYFLFGLASYQLYFLIILMWFYVLMPLWRVLARLLLAAPRLGLSTLLLLQIAGNYYSSYLLDADFSNEYINLLFQYRTSWWPFHYLFIFLLGAVCGLRYREAIAYLESHSKQVVNFFFFSLLSMLSLYYGLIYLSHYSPEAAVNTGHQLSPPGVLYTFGSSLFLLLLFSSPHFPHWLGYLLGRLGDYSFAIYLVHPLVMYYLIAYLSDHNIVMTAPVVIAFYCITVCISQVIAVVLRIIGRNLPLLGICLNGSAVIDKKSG